MRTTTWMMVLSCIAVVGMNGLRAYGQGPQNKVWVFLVTGKPTDGVAQEELIKKQQAHLANFKRLAGLNQLFVAGPVMDPGKKIRGIVVVAAEDQKRLDPLFAPDPYVMEGFMKLEGNAIAEMDGEFKMELNPASMEEHRIVVWSRSNGKPKDAKVASERSSSPRPLVLQAHLDYWKEMREKGRVAIRARFTEDAPRFGVAIMPAIGDDAIEAWLKRDPMYQHGFIEYQIMPQYLTKDAVRTR